MLTFRRALLVAGCVLSLFILFGGSRQKDRLVSLEARLKETERSSENALRELQQSSDQRNSRLEKEIERLEKERKVLRNQVQELRHLPDATATVEEQLKYQYPYDVHSLFPAFVWQTWKYDFLDSRLEPQLKLYMEGWRNINVDFVHEVVNDEMAEKLIKHLYRNVPRVVEAYVSLPDPVLKADFFRYLILFARGGVYSDADTELLKPTPNWLPSWLNPSDVGLVVGIEADPDQPDWHKWYARRIQLCQWTIQAKPGHPALRKLISAITQKTLARKKAGTLKLGSEGKNRGGDIMEWTGPSIFTDTLFDYFNSPTLGMTEDITWKTFTGIEDAKQIGDVLVLPITCFSPGVGHMGSKGIGDPLAFVQHHFEGSWKPVEERM